MEGEEWYYIRDGEQVTNTIISLYDRLGLLTSLRYAKNGIVYLYIYDLTGRRQ